VEQLSSVRLRGSRSSAAKSVVRGKTEEKTKVLHEFIVSTATRPEERVSHFPTAPGGCYE
jgi:hypothetical protein